VSPADTLPWEEVRDSLTYFSGTWPAREVLEASRFRHESPYVRVKQAFNDYADDCFPPEQPVLACAVALMQKLNRELTYAPGETNIGTPLTEVLQNRRGVCQDFAHLMIACLRAKGLAARYVSGYIRLRPAPPLEPEPECDDALATFLGRADTPHASNDSESGTGSSGNGANGSMPREATEEPHAATAMEGDYVGAGASHAWVSVYSPPFGWLDLDPTNNLHVGTDHVTVAWGRDFGDVSPLRGVILGGGTHDLSVCVTVEPLDDAASVQ
jgi:transglutaminase-like putative cysteine protease